MPEPTILLRAAALSTSLLLAGWMLARLGRTRVDLFAAVWWGLAATSLVGVVLGRLGRFSLGTVVLVVLGIAATAALAGGFLGKRNGTPRPDTSSPACRAFACGVALAAVAWCWPPFETFLAASDSTMYVDAGIHLARTGAYEVTDTIAADLPPELAQALFMSVGALDTGPYVRLAGGLLVDARGAPTATPAFFPLLPTWTGLLAAIGGPPLAPAIAPLATGLAAWALVSFAGETIGLAAAVPTALFFLANFVVWWFGRFPMSEPLTVAFVWGGLVFLARGGPFAAGVMLGLGGVARAETLLFAAAALAWWAVWTEVGRRDVVYVAVGAIAAGLLAPIALVASPNHQLAYLRNDLTIAWMQVLFRLLPAFADGRALGVLTLLPTIPLLVGVVAAWRRRPVVRTLARFTIVCATLAVAIVYLRVGGRAELFRHLGWVAGAASWVGLALALGGAVVAWIRGGAAMRLAILLVALVAVIFLVNPRVAPYQPWSMRRYLPIVLPGVALFAGVAVSALWTTSRRGFAALAVVLAATSVAFEVRPIVAKRAAPYYAGSLATTRELAALVPDDAVVVIDGGFAELQMQVALWLVLGRETVLATGGGPAWRVLLTHLLANGRTAYWLQSRLSPRPEAPGLVFTPVPPSSDFAIHLPDSPSDTPPTAVMRKLVLLQLYNVTAGR